MLYVLPHRTTGSSSDFHKGPLGFRASGLGFRDEGLGIRVWGIGFKDFFRSTVHKVSASTGAKRRY